MIKSENDWEGIAGGSGVILDNDIIATNCHVTNAAAENSDAYIMVKNINKDNFDSATIYKRAPEHDICIIKKDDMSEFSLKMRKVKNYRKTIDPFIFFDNGKAYLYHVRLQDGNRIFVAEMEDDLSAIKPETLKECINAQSGWEDTQDVPWPVAEGPTVIKKDGKYYMFYSANDFRNPDYAVGYATSDSPSGPWTKEKTSPIISRGIVGYFGSGHGDLIQGTDSTMYYVFHTHNTNEVVHPRKTALIQIDLDNLPFKVLEDSFEWLTLR